MIMPEQRWAAPDLHERVAVVTGASRGVGRGIALVLGECGATVYVTGRSTRGGPTTVGHGEHGGSTPQPETVEETAELVTARGGLGIPLRVDHTVDGEVEALFGRVMREHGRLDLLVNNVSGAEESDHGRVVGVPLLEQPLEFWQRAWQAMFVAHVRAHLLATRLAFPLMAPQRRGLIIDTTFSTHRWPGISLLYLATATTNLISSALARELSPHNIAAIALGIGNVRTEGKLRWFHTDEQHWQEVTDLREMHSTEYAGRAVAMLAADSQVLEHTGRLLELPDLARVYGFTDIDGRVDAGYH